MSADKDAVKPSRAEEIEHRLESALFATRWLLAPVYFGLVAALAIILFKFFEQLWNVVSHLGDGDKYSEADALMVALLNLVDIALLGNLILIVIFAGYENFVSRLSVAHDHIDKPTWMGHVDFSGLKMKLIGSLVAISAILLLKEFVQIGNGEDDFDTLRWQIAIHLTFVVSGLIFAVMDYWGARRLKVLSDLHSPDVEGSASEPFDPNAA